MKKKAVGSKRVEDYPASTHGGRVAARGRQKANKMSEAEREEYFRKGMVLIYGGDVPKKSLA
jgi:hypothetical protein